MPSPLLSSSSCTYFYPRRPIASLFVAVLSYCHCSTTTNTTIAVTTTYCSALVGYSPLIKQMLTMYTIVDRYAMALWCDTEGKTWAAIAIMANFQSFVWWQRYFEIHTHDHHWRSVALIKQKQPATDGYDKKRLPPLIAPKNFFTQADKKRHACFQYWINSFHRKYEQW